MRWLIAAVAPLMVFAAPPQESGFSCDQGLRSLLNVLLLPRRGWRGWMRGPGGAGVRGRAPLGGVGKGWGGGHSPGQGQAWGPLGHRTGVVLFQPRAGGCRPSRDPRAATPPGLQPAPGASLHLLAWWHLQDVT